MPKIHASQHRPAKLHKRPSSGEIDEMNIRGRVCQIFRENPKKTNRRYNEQDEICECGFSRHAHKHEVNNADSRWTVLRNTLELVDAAYGSFEEGSLFVRIDIHTPLEKIEKILLEAWQIPKPRFIVSIVGETQYFRLPDRLQTNFIDGIVDIAQKSNAWLLTNGYNNGIVHLVGQAINKVQCIEPDRTITAIGICKWGCLRNIDLETNSKNKNKQKIALNQPLGDNSRLRREQRELERNHTHYLMLDDGTTKDDSEDYRTQLAIHIGRLKDEENTIVPVVTIVVEGGQRTINNIYYDLREGVPIVVINGSGRVADFFNRWLLYTKDHDYQGFDSTFVYGLTEKVLIDQTSEDSRRNHDATHRTSPGETCGRIHVDYLQDKLSKMFHKYRDQINDDLKNILSENEVIDDLILQVMFCLQPAVRSNITIFNLNSNSNLSETIFRCICQSRQKLNKRKEIDLNEEIQVDTENVIVPEKLKQDKRKSYSLIHEKAQKVERSRLLELAMDWDCIDVAREFIFKNSLDNIMNKKQRFIGALQKNRPMFVYEFLKLKIDLCEVFPLNQKPRQPTYQYKSFIGTLYTKEMVNNGQNHLKSYMHMGPEHNEAIVDNIETLNRIFRNMIGDYMHTLYYDRLEDEQSDRYFKGLKKKRTEERKLSDEEQRQIMRTYFLRDLFLWSIVMNYADMAKVLLSFMDYRICSALIATKIFKEYQRKAPYGDLQKSYTKSIEYFEQYAIDCLDQCDNRDPEKACQIILQRNELYGYVTCLQVAYDADDKKFLSAPCCIEAVNNIWYDKLHPDQSDPTRKTSLLLGFVTLGLTAPLFVSYRPPRKEATAYDLSYRKLKSYGIDYCDSASLKYAITSSSEPAHERYFNKLIEFHQASSYKLFNHFITYLFFLLLFSYVLLFKFDPLTANTPSIDWTEILTIILVTCMLIEEISYFCHQDSLTFFGKVAKYFTQLFKFITFFGFLLFYIGLIVRFTYANSQVDFTAARIIMALDVEIWWLRSLSFIIIFPLLGPHLVSIGKMLKDLLFFMCIIAVVMIGYGVSTRSMAYYPKDNAVVTRGNYSIDARFDGRSVFRQIIYPVYYLMYGEFGKEMENLDKNRDAGWSMATYVLLAIHMMLVNILLTNLLIALFSKRFGEVYQQAQEIWHSQNYAVVRAYNLRAPLFPPFSVLYDMYVLASMPICYIRHKYNSEKHKYQPRVFQIIPENFSISEEWREFEANATYEYAHTAVKTLKDASIKSTTITDMKMKDKSEALIQIKNDTITIDGLKQIEDGLLDMNIMVNKRIKEKTPQISK